jgi:drug/metabolite transporter (DMT)-like permease
MASPKWLVVVAFLLVYLIWGSTYLAIAKAIDTIPPFVMAGTRFLAAGGVLYAAARLMGAPKPVGIEWRTASIVGLFLLLGGNGGVVLAQRTVPSGLAALIVAGSAIWMSIFDALRPGGRWPSWPVAVGLLGGLGGVALLLGPWGPGRVDPFGAACLVAATIAWALGSIYAKSARLPSSPLVATAVEMMAGGAGLMILSVVTGQLGSFKVSDVSAASVLAWVYLGVFGSIVAFTAYVWLLKVRPPSQVATYAYVNPVVAVFLGWYFLSEPVSTRMFVAAAAILASVALITRFSGPRPKPVATPELEVVHEQRA